MEPTIKRIKNKTKNFTIISNELFKRSDVSARAKGIFVYIMTLPDDWQIYKAEIYKHFSEGRTAIDTAFAELEKLGYITKTRRKAEGGKFDGWDYTIQESIDTPDIPKTDSPEIRKSDNPISGNQQLPSTNSLQSIDNIYSLDSKKEVMKEKSEVIPYSDIITYLNDKSNSRYRVTESTKKLIHARFKEGFTKEDFMRVIDNKVLTWKGNEWEKYLRPETLFCASKFQGYLNEKPITKNEKDGLNLYAD